MIYACVENSMTDFARTSIDWLAHSLQGSTLVLREFVPEDGDLVCFQIEGGVFDQAVLMAGNGAVFSIVPIMSNVVLRPITSDEREVMIRHIPEKHELNYKQLGIDTGMHWIVIESKEGIWFIWTMAFTVVLPEVVQGRYSGRMGSWTIRMQDEPLWKGGPLLSSI